MKNIHEKMKEELMEAMREKNEVRTLVLRDLLTAFTNEAVKLGKKAQDILGDDEALKVIKRKAKEREDSIESFEKGNRDDLVQKEKAELEIIKGYLPEQLSDEELEEVINKVIEETGAMGVSDIGRVIGKVMERVGNQAEGRRVSEIVKEKFQ